jgi:hypothetical protein
VKDAFRHIFSYKCEGAPGGRQCDQPMYYIFCPNWGRQKCGLDVHHSAYPNDGKRCLAVGSLRATRSEDDDEQRAWLSRIAANSPPEHIRLLCQRCHHNQPGITHAPGQAGAAQPDWYKCPHEREGNGERESEGANGE